MDFTLSQMHERPKDEAPMSGYEADRIVAWVKACKDSVTKPEDSIAIPGWITTFMPTNEYEWAAFEHDPMEYAGRCYLLSQGPNCMGSCGPLCPCWDMKSWPS